MAMKTFFVGVKAVIVQDGKVLLVEKHADDEVFWDVPGGRIDGDEYLMQTLDRELREELPNIQSYKAGRLLHAYRVHKDILGDVSLVLLFYEVTDARFQGEARISDEHTGLRWMAVDEAMETVNERIRGALAALQI